MYNYNDMWKSNAGIRESEWGVIFTRSSGRPKHKVTFEERLQGNLQERRNFFCRHVYPAGKRARAKSLRKALVFNGNPE